LARKDHKARPAQCLDPKAQQVLEARRVLLDPKVLSVLKARKVLKEFLDNKGHRA
jgi:hypothetical protein